MMRGIWKRKNGLTLLQLKQLEMERAIEQLASVQEQELFDAIDRLPKQLADLEAEHRDYIEEIERRIEAGWKPNAGDWAGIAISLQVFAKRRKELTDPLGLTEVTKVRALSKKMKLINEMSRYTCMTRLY